MSKLDDAIRKIAPNATQSEIGALESAINAEIRKAVANSGGGNRGGSGSTSNGTNMFAALKSYIDKATYTTLNFDKTLLDLADTIVSVGNTGMGLANFFGDAILTIMAMDQALRDSVNKSMGITGALATNIRNTLAETSAETLKYGITLRDIDSAYASFVNTLGRAVPLNKELLADTLKIAKANGLQLSSATSFLAKLEGLGIGLMEGPKILEEMGDRARSLGLTTSEFMKFATDNLSLINTLGFDKGVRGFTDIAASASAINFDLTKAAAKAADLFEIDNAVEMAAKLNVLGGEFGRLGNAMDLMFMPTNDFEGFSEAIMDAQKQFVSFNNATGEFVASGLDMRRAKEFASIMGKDLNTVITEAKAAARRDMISDELTIFPGIGEEDKELIASMGQIGAGGVITLDGKDLNSLYEEGKLDETLAQLRQQEKEAEMTTEDILREQLNAANLANFYLKAMSMQFITGGEQSLMSLLGEDFNKLAMGLAKEGVATMDTLPEIIENIINGTANSQIPTVYSQTNTELNELSVKYNSLGEYIEKVKKALEGGKQFMGETAHKLNITVNGESLGNILLNNDQSKAINVYTQQQVMQSGNPNSGSVYMNSN